MGRGARVPLPSPVPPADPWAPGAGGAAGHRDLPIREETCGHPSHGDPRDGPGKVCRGNKIGGSGGGGSRGEEPGGLGSESGPHPLRPAAASSLRAPSARGPGLPGVAGPGPGPGRGLWARRVGRGAAGAGPQGRAGGEALGGGGWGERAPRDGIGLAGAAPRRARTGRRRRGGTRSPDWAGVPDKPGAGSGGAAPRGRAGDTIISFSFKLACCRRRRSSRAAGRRLDR